MFASYFREVVNKAIYVQRQMLKLDFKNNFLKNLNSFC